MDRKLTAGRRNEIARLLAENGSVKASELARKYQVSAETIRKDMLWLEKEGIARKSYGGAVATDTLMEIPFDAKQDEYRAEKQRIGEAAAGMIAAGSSLFLDGGTTTLALASFLKDRDDLTVFTNSVSIAELLTGAKCRIFVLGGMVRPSSRCCVGEWTERTLSDIHTDISFLGSDGFARFDGPSCVSYEEVAIKKCAIACSGRTYIVADHTKCLSTPLYKVCRWNDVTGLIMDDPERTDEDSRKRDLSNAGNESGDRSDTDAGMRGPAGADTGKRVRPDTDAGMRARPNVEEAAAGAVSGSGPQSDAAFIRQKLDRIRKDTHVILV